ncbi:MAG: caspase family protein, partial [Roseiarcus sp.]
AYVVLSTRQGKTAEDGLDGQGSPFARAFATVLPTPGLRIEDAYYRIRERVRGDTHGEQVPDVIRSDLPEGGVVLMAGAGP